MRHLIAAISLGPAPESMARPHLWGLHRLALVVAIASAFGCSPPAFAHDATNPLPAVAAATDPGQTTRPGTGYRGIWFTLGQFSEYGDKYSGGLGTYTANHVPLAVYAPTVHRTFFVYGGTRAGERHLLIMVGSFDHASGTVSRPWMVHDKGGVNDPHDNPSLALDDHGHLWVFISGRGRSRPGFIYRSRQPWDITDFEFIASREMTYPQPWFVPGKGFLLLFTKYTHGRELYFATSADGRTWRADTKLAGIGGHYQVSAPANTRGRIGTFFNRHPGGNVDRRTDLYYLETPDFGATWTTVDGTPVDLPLTQIEHPARVIDYTSQPRLQYTCDLAFDDAGHPLLLHVTSADHRPGPGGDPREWVLACWTGDRWLSHLVCRGDHNYDMGSLYVEGPSWRVLAPTDPGPQPYGTGGEMIWWRSDDAGHSWRLERPVTRNSPFNHTYARRPLHARDPFYAFWADGHPGQFSPSRLFFTNRNGDRVWQLPESMTDAQATPLPLPLPLALPQPVTIPFNRE
jgi:hypothetical protein